MKVHLSTLWKIHPLTRPTLPQQLSHISHSLGDAFKMDVLRLWSKAKESEGGFMGEAAPISSFESRGTPLRNRSWVLQTAEA